MPKNSKIKLLDFDEAKMGQGMAQASQTYIAIKKDARRLAYFCDETGSGAFSPMVASAAATYIKEGIQGKRAISGLGGLPALSEQTIEAKGSTKFHFWTGAFSESVSYNVTKAGKRSIAFVTMKEGTTKGGRVNYNTLAKWLEHGTQNQPARPVMHLAMHDFVAKKLPPMLRATKKAIVKSIVDNHAGGGAQGFDVGALATINVAQTFKPIDVFKQSPFQTEGSAVARQVLSSVGFANARLNRWG